MYNSCFDPVHPSKSKVRSVFFFNKKKFFRMWGNILLMCDFKALDGFFCLDY